MKFTSYDLMKAMGLQVGDNVKYLGEIWTVRYNDDKIHCVYLYRYDGEKHCHLELFEMFDKTYEILPKPKRVGDLKCGDFKDCNKCPLVLCCDLIDGFSTKDTFDEILETLIIRDQEIYDLLKARLDKEVSE